MEKELEREIKITQATLGKYVKRPPLSEKLLKKPPFRFLHDIVTTVIKNTSFFEGLFDEEELVSENVKDRDAKILFLTKTISVLNIATGKALSAKPSKIVAGQEPEKTNELLQCLGYALENKISSVEAVQKYKDGVAQISKNEIKNKGQTPKNKKGDENEIKNKKEVDKTFTSRSRDKLINPKKDVNQIVSSRTPKTNNKTISKEENKRSTEKKKGSSPKSKLDDPKDKKVIDAKSSAETLSQSEPLENPISPKENEYETGTIEDNKKNERDTQIENIDTIPKLISDNIENKIELDSDNKKLSVSEEQKEIIVDNSEILSSHLEKENNTSNSSEIKKQMQNDKVVVNQESIQNEEQSIKELEHEKLAHGSNENSVGKTKSEPEKKILDVDTKPQDKTDNKNLLRPPSVRPPSSRPGAPRLREKNEEILQPGPVLIGKVNIIIENTPPDEDDEASLVIVDPDNDTAQTEADSADIPSMQHGHLVQQILDSQKGLSLSGKPEIEWEFGAQKAREAANQEIEQMKFNIQALSRVANPLGKLLDHVQEDVEVMRQELHQWTKIYEEATVELGKKKITNEESLIPLHAKKKQLDADIEEKQEKINDLKVMIQKNSSRINKLLANDYVQ